MLRPHEINAGRHFVAGWYQDSAEDSQLWSQLLVEARTNPARRPGHMGRGQVLPDRKLSEDFILPEVYQAPYRRRLAHCVREYIKLYPDCNGFSPFDPQHPIVVQWYGRGGHFQQWHCERGTAEYPVSARWLVFMTYLNTVVEGGHTEFREQALSIQPQQGLTLIWPTDWTHMHRGLPVIQGDKAIITGWLGFVR